jgi:hypothetical protein
MSGDYEGKCPAQSFARACAQLLFDHVYGREPRNTVPALALAVIEPWSKVRSHTHHHTRQRRYDCAFNNQRQLSFLDRFKPRTREQARELRAALDAMLGAPTTRVTCC